MIGFRLFWGFRGVGKGASHRRYIPVWDIQYRTILSFSYPASKEAGRQNEGWMLCYERGREGRDAGPLGTVAFVARR